MKKHGRARFLNAIFIMLVAIPTFTVFCPIGISGQTVQQKQDAVQLAAHVWVQPAATRVYGMTPRRLWATTAAMLGLVAVVIGGLNLAIAKGGLGTGNGVIGGAVALVLGLIAMALGGLALARSRRTG